MAKYISLIRFTEQGAKDIKNSIRRAEAFDEAAEAAGVRIVGQYWTMGGYDGVLITEAETEAKALHWLTELSSYGNVKPETLKAFEASEFEEILA